MSIRSSVDRATAKAITDAAILRASREALGDGRLGVPLTLAPIVGNVLDVASTLAVIASGKGTEANPLLRTVARNPLSFLAVKAAVGLASTLIARSMAKHNEKAGKVAAVVAAAIPTAAAVHNTTILLKKGK